MREYIVRLDLPDMPECCSKCNMPDAICSRRMLMWTRNNGTINGFNSRHPDCPIIAVMPEHHGRLVDADAMDKCVYNDIPIQVFGSVKKMAAVRQIIEDAPTIIHAAKGEE